MVVMHTDASTARLPFQIAPPLSYIREYREEDAEAVARMWRESASAWPGGGPGGGEHSTAARVRQEQRDLNTLATLIAWRPDPTTGEARAAGYCSLFEYTAEAGAAYVGTLSVHPAFQGQGIGRDLLKVALERTVALGYTRLDLNTWAGNLKAVPLYKKSGYFWVPETSVKMENYLPLIFRLGPAQAFFREADWYRDLVRDLSVRPDEERLGKLEVYTYLWQHHGRRLKVVIDRRAKGIVGVETERFSVATSIDEPRLPVGGERIVTWRVENYGSRPVTTSIIAEGEDSVRCTFQAAAVVERSQEWSAPATAEQPQSSPPRNRPANRIRSTVVVDGSPLPLLLGTLVSQPVSISFEERRRWLVPGVARRLWVTAENSLDERVAGTLRLAASPGLELALEHQASSPAAALPQAAPASQELAFDLAPQRRASWPIRLRAAVAGSYVLRAEATVDVFAPGEDPATQPAASSADARPDGQAAAAAEVAVGPGARAAVPPLGKPARRGLHTRLFELAVHCGDVGAIFVEQDEERVTLATDRLLLEAPLKPRGDWAPSIEVRDRDSGQPLVRLASSLGPPFVPSIFTTSTWLPRIEREAASVVLTLSTSPAALPGLTFERLLRLSASGLIRLTHRVTNAAAIERRLEVSADTGVVLGPAASSKVAVPLTTGLVIESSQRFPDWQEPEVARPERYAEQWMAEFGEGWVGATIWPDSPMITSIEAGWSAPSLTFDLGALPPGGSVETPPIYIYAGPGDWRLARALWQQLMAPDAPDDLPHSRPAHVARLERTVFDVATAETVLRVESERTRAISGAVDLELHAEGAAAHLEGRTFQRVRAGAPHTARVRVMLPDRAQAVPATLVLQHERETERQETALIRLGDGAGPVRIDLERDGAREQVRLDNGRLRLALLPGRGQLARIASLQARTGTDWVEQLFASDEPSTFVWFNPWLGGIHPTLFAGAPGGFPSRLIEETFTWRPLERTGAQGNRWRGVLLAAETSARGQVGLGVELSYLTLAGSNVLALVMRLENRSGARIRPDLSFELFLQPGGQRDQTVLYYERDGELRHQRRVHGGSWGESGRWCILEAPDGLALAVLAATPQARVAARDMGYEGVHPQVFLSRPLAPGEATELVAYLVVADDLAQAKRYRSLAGSAWLP